MLVELIWQEDPVQVDSEKWYPEGKVPKYKMLETFEKWCKDSTAYHACTRVFTQSEYVRDCFRLLHIRGICKLVVYYGEEMVECGDYGALDYPSECNSSPYTPECWVNEMICTESMAKYEKDRGIEDDD